MKAAWLFSALAVVAAKSPNLPRCGLQDYPIGHGVLLNMAMVNGSPYVTLYFEVAGKGRGGLRLAKPISVGVDVPNAAKRVEPEAAYIYFKGLYLTSAGGERIYVRSVTLTCGRVATLSQTLSRKHQEWDSKGQGVIGSFSGAEKRKCLQALETEDRIAFTLVTDETAPRTLIVKAHLPITRMVARARRLFAKQLALSKDGKCFISPPLPVDW